MSEYRLSIATSDLEPFIPLETIYNRPKAERNAIKESRMYPGVLVMLEWVDSNSQCRKVFYRRGRKYKPA